MAIDIVEKVYARIKEACRQSSGYPDKFADGKTPWVISDIKDNGTIEGIVTPYIKKFGQFKPGLGIRFIIDADGTIKATDLAHWSLPWLLRSCGEPEPTGRRSPATSMLAACALAAFASGVSPIMPRRF